MFSVLAKFLTHLHVMLIVYLLLAIVALIYLLIKKRYNYWNERGFLCPPSSFPFGSVKGVGTSLTTFQVIDNVYKKYKGKASAVGVFFFIHPTILPIDLELIKRVLVQDFSSFHDQGLYYNKEDDPISANLLFLECQEWKERRVKMAPLFTSSKIKMMFETVDSIGNELIKVVDKKLKISEDFEVRELAGCFTADVIGNVAFGLDCNCLEDPSSEFLKNVRRITDKTSFETLKFILASTLPTLARKLHIPQNGKEPSDFFISAFLQTFAYREKNNIKRNDFVSMLLKLKDSFTVLELAAEAFAVYAAGLETSSAVITFVLYELAINPDIQQRLRDEIKSEIEKNAGKLTYDLLCDLKYLDQVVNETLRHYPPVPNRTRNCMKDYEIPGTSLVIPKGTVILIGIYSVLHDPEYFPDPYKFDPERFTPENVKTRDPFTFLPFGKGPRSCIGMRFGSMQSKIGIVKLLLNYEFEPIDKTTIPLKFSPSSLFVVPVGGVWLKVKKI